MNVEIIESLDGELGGVKLDLAPNSILHYLAGAGHKGYGEDFEETTDKLAKLIANTIHVVKSEALPTMHDLTNKIQEEITKRIGEQAAGVAPAIVQFEVPEVFLQMIDDGVIKVRNVSELPRKMLRFKNSLQLSEKMSANADFTAEEKAFLETVSAETLARVEKMFFEIKDIDVYRSANVVAWTQSTKDDIYVINMAARTLRGNIPDGTIGELSVYNETMDAIVAITDRAIVSLARDYKNAIAKEIVFYSGKETAVVVKPIYADYISRNGDVDVILGAWAKQIGMLSITHALKSEGLAADWNKYAGLKLRNLELENHKVYQAVYYEFFVNRVEVDPSYAVDDYLPAVKQMIRTLSSLAVTDISHVVRTGVGRYLFGKIDAYGFFDQIDHYQDTTKTINEAVTLAITDRVVDIVLGYVVVEA